MEKVSDRCASVQYTFGGQGPDVFGLIHGNLGVDANLFFWHWTFLLSAPVIIKHRTCSFGDKGIGAALLAGRDDGILGFLKLPDTAVLHLGAQ